VLHEKIKCKRLTRRRIPGMASTLPGKNPAALRRRCMTIAPTTAVMKTVHIRNASLCLSAVLGENSNMKLWLILVDFHMYKLHPYINKCRLNNANTLHNNIIITIN
jgi:hypothetical protein